MDSDPNSRGSQLNLHLARVSDQKNLFDEEKLIKINSMKLSKDFPSRKQLAFEFIHLVLVYLN